MNTKCWLFSIVLFVVPDNSYLVIFQYYFTYRISLFRNQNLNIQERSELIASFFCGCVFLIHVFYLLINVENQLFQLQSHSLDIPCHPSGIYANEYDH